MPAYLVYAEAIKFDSAQVWVVFDKALVSWMRITHTAVHGGDLGCPEEVSVTACRTEPVPRYQKELDGYLTQQSVRIELYPQACMKNEKAFVGVA